MKKLIILIAIALVGYACEKAAIEPDVRTVKSTDCIEQEVAQQMLSRIMAYAGGTEMQQDKGIDSTVNLKARLWKLSSGGLKYVVFDLSIASDTTVAQMNSLYYTIRFTGDLAPVQGTTGVVHNLWPPSAIPMIGNGVLLENAVGQTLYGAWYSLQSIYVPSSTGQSSFGMPVVGWILYTGTAGTVTLDLDPNCTGISKDGYNNYIVASTPLTIE